MQFYLTLLLFLPLINFFLLYFFKNVNKKFIKDRRNFCLCAGVFNSFLIFFFSLYLFLVSFLNGIIYQLEYSYWFDTGNLLIRWVIIFDGLTVCMLLIISAISFFVHVYSLEYLDKDPFILKFFSYISLFTFFMLFLVTSNNYLQLFLGWEGVGLCSFLLISFWGTRIQAYKSAIKAMLLNRIGDFFLLLAVGVIHFSFRTADFFKIFTCMLYGENFFEYFNYVVPLDLISLLLFLGAIGKSAQIGLHTWLPDAMEGPTPVSALIHAATMVTAGVFLLIRSSYIIETSELTLLLVLFFGGVTLFFSATVSFAQSDIKKIIAYSTCSQLGYMFLACGCSLYNVALYHLVTHAFFKALLFLVAGSIIHGLLDEQNIKRFGSLQLLQPVTYIALLIGTLAIVGFPFLSGYYSKDGIFENLCIIIGEYFLPFYCLALSTALFTAIYSFQIIYWVFCCRPGISRIYYKFVQESGWIICLVLCFLALFSIFCGYFFFDIFIGVSSPFLGASIYNKSSFVEQGKLESLIVWFLKDFPFFAGVVGGVVIICWYKLSYFWVIKIKYKFYLFILFFYKKWLFDYFYNIIANFFFLNSYAWVYRILDKGVLEYLGPRGIMYFCFLVSNGMLNRYKKTVFILILYLFINLCFLVVSVII